eukprot:TRINITY_DN3235_c0_g1_i1.p1 TRINITY_DN3235_c0_g1~~TRINITY_DN3235_c0_g1_i1.p1  ORF type:complete len:369 (+),score=66.50 TRINITY_DN3235_c0_g1_i1:78-1184(+)
MHTLFRRSFVCWRHNIATAKAVKLNAVRDVSVLPQTLPPNIQPGQIFVRMLAVPIHPADLNMIDGTYPEKPHAGFLGTDGVGVVEDVGHGVSSLKRGDWVIPAGPSGLGTWRQAFICQPDDVYKVRNDIPVESAANILVNSCTAWRMLHDFATLKPGDVVIQNASNSTAGQAVIQLAKVMKVHTINVVRDTQTTNTNSNTRGNEEMVVRQLKELGADWVISEKDLADESKRKALLSSVSRPIPLALNAVGGTSAINMVRLLSKNGQLVTYGGMSRRPVSLSTSALIFRNIASRGFWLVPWMKSHSREECEQMVTTIADIMKNGQLKVFVEKISFDELAKLLKTYIDTKALELPSASVGRLRLKKMVVF